MDKGNVKDGRKDGTWEYYHENGQLRGKGNWKNNFNNITRKG